VRNTPYSFCPRRSANGFRGDLVEKRQDLLRVHILKFLPENKSIYGGILHLRKAFPRLSFENPVAG
jgi:hypothetical protein